MLTPVITLDRLRELLTDGQRALAEQVISLRPGDYGVTAPYAGDLEPVPPDLVRVSAQQYNQHGQRRTLADKYVPRHVFTRYSALNEAFTGEHPGRRLLIRSCYRSPAYSQHTTASKAAIDFKTVDGAPSDTDPADFARTVEYAWLREHAGRFRFHESWPPGNEFGMRAEPWHWQYRPPGTRPAIPLRRPEDPTVVSRLTFNSQKVPTTKRDEARPPHVAPTADSVWM